MNVDPNITKYVIKAKIVTDSIIVDVLRPDENGNYKSIGTDGVVEKPDVVGAIFGQTEGLLGEELDLRDLQKSGKLPYSFRDTGALYSYSVFYTIS